MENISIIGKKEMPTVNFNTNGILEISGHSYPENATRIYEPLLQFVKELTVEKVQFTLNLEYFNTSTQKYLQFLFKELDRNDNIEQAEVIWCYDEDDDEALEEGEMFEEYVEKCQFTYSENKIAA